MLLLYLSSHPPTHTHCVCSYWVSTHKSNQGQYFTCSLASPLSIVLHVHVMILHVMRPHVMRLHVMRLHVMILHVMRLHVMRPHVMRLHVMRLHVMRPHVMILHVMILHVMILHMYVHVTTQRKTTSSLLVINVFKRKFSSCWLSIYWGITCQNTCTLLFPVQS